MPGFSSGCEATGRRRAGWRPGRSPSRVAGPVPGEVVPASHGVDRGLVADGALLAHAVLVGHVDVRIPEGAEASPAGHVPGGVGGPQLFRSRDEGLVLDDERQLLGRDGPGLHQARPRPCRRGGRRRFARVDAEARETVGVVVQVEEAGALVVGEVERGRARARVVGGAGRAFGDRLALGVEPHVGDVDQAGPRAVRARLARRCDPLVLRAAADPRGEPAVQVQRRAVLRVDASPPSGPAPSLVIVVSTGRKRSPAAPAASWLTNLMRTGRPRRARISGPR